MSIQIAVSLGEFLDKLSILEIKLARIADADKAANVSRELETLRKAWAVAGHDLGPIAEECKRLKLVNERLWDIEDAIRDKERHRCFDAEFVELARAVYHENDERAALKRQINEKLDSSLIEEKSYADYRVEP